jgi:hypothetical protein
VTTAVAATAVAAVITDQSIIVVDAILRPVVGTPSIRPDELAGT